MASFRLRDRDAIITSEGIIFRVYGYFHPPDAFVCDPEYAPADIYESRNPRAYRARGNQVYYKFYSDEGLRFVQQKHPRYMVWYEPIQRRLAGVKHKQVIEIRKPERILQTLLEEQPTDILIKALHALFNHLLPTTSLSKTNFGVFGSLLHNFYHPSFSDMDLIIYGKDELERLKEALNALSQEHDSPLRNEFNTISSIQAKKWRFQNYTLKEYVWHQKRKMTYTLFRHKESCRTIKTEFEPVKLWEEIQNEYNSAVRITRRRWIKLLARITEDEDAPFMPSIYQIEPVEILKGQRVENIQRIVSFVEEFRMQAQRDELVIVEGNLEEVSTPKQTFHQVILTYGPRYYEQTLKVHANHSARIM